VNRWGASAGPAFRMTDTSTGNPGRTKSVREPAARPSASSGLTHLASLVRAATPPASLPGPSGAVSFPAFTTRVRTMTNRSPSEPSPVSAVPIRASRTVILNRPVSMVWPARAAGCGGASFRAPSEPPGTRRPDLTYRAGWRARGDYARPGIVAITEGKTGLTEFSSADLDRLLGEARATLEAMRADRPTEPGGDGTGRAVGEAAGGDAGGRVTATAEHGRLTDVRFDAKARKLPSKELARLVVTAVNAALDNLRLVPAARTAEAAGDAPGGERQEENDLQQMEQLTQAINDALARIGGGR
jgi:hypothetical protein